EIDGARHAAAARAGARCRRARAMRARIEAQGRGDLDHGRSDGARRSRAAAVLGQGGRAWRGDLYPSRRQSRSPLQAFSSLEQRGSGVRGGGGNFVAVVGRRVENVPAAKICVSHGGGYMPYYMGRIDRNYAEKPNTRVNMSKPPIDYLRMLYFDSCVYERAVLQHLVEKVGAERVLLGSDYPVGEVRPIEFVTDTDTLSPVQQDACVGTNAAALLGLANP